MTHRRGDIAAGPRSNQKRGVPGCNLSCAFQSETPPPNHLWIQPFARPNEWARGVHFCLLESNMENQFSVYRVEISGWDLNEQFFVERAALEWGVGEQKTVLVHRRARQGALLFVRLLESSAPERSFPVAYRVREIREREGGSMYELILRQVWPAPDGKSPGGTAMFKAACGRSLGMN
jgi:hypothetical protein